jgi:hypothetical protein
MRRRRLFSGLLAALAVLATSGCFYSEKPLLARSEWAQPIRGGLWESLVPMAEPEWKGMPETDKAANHCRLVGGAPFCAERMRITALPDKAYQLRGDGEDDFDAFQMAPLSGGDFIVQQVETDGSAEYALASKATPDSFSIRLPSCERDTYLHRFAMPDEPGSSRCKVADRAGLGSLFADYRAKSSEADAKVYRRIGD